MLYIYIMDIPAGHSEIEKIKDKLNKTNLPSDLREKANQQIERISLGLKYGGNLSQIDITEKNTIAKSIAEAMNRKFARIAFGGMSSILDLRGQSKTTPEAEPGLILKAIRRIGTKNPVILLDELDRIAPESKGAIMGVLVELLDPEQ